MSRNNFFPSFEYHMLYVLYPFVTYLLNFPRSNGNVVIVLNFATLKNLTVKSTTFPHRNDHECTSPSPDGKTSNQIYHILADRRRYSNIFDV
jgi:hypothetical protein